MEKNFEKKFNFDGDIDDHHCILPDKPCAIQYRVPLKHFFIRLLLPFIIISKKNPKTKKYFQSEDAIYKEKIRHVFSDFWYIVHPLSVFG